MGRGLLTAGLLVGGLALAACGSGGGSSVQARQSGETTTTTAEPTTTMPAEPPPTATNAPPTSAAPAELPCTVEALSVAYTAKFGNVNGALQVQKCVEGWATSALSRGFDPPVFTLYQAEGDHWVALTRSGGKLCEGRGVPAAVAPQIGCDT